MAVFHLTKCPFNRFGLLYKIKKTHSILRLIQVVLSKIKMIGEIFHMRDLMTLQKYSQNNWKDFEMVECFTQLPDI